MSVAKVSQGSERNDVPKVPWEIKRGFCCKFIAEPNSERTFAQFMPESRVACFFESLLVIDVTASQARSCSILNVFVFYVNI